MSGSFREPKTFDRRESNPLSSESKDCPLELCTTIPDDNRMLFQGNPRIERIRVGRSGQHVHEHRVHIHVGLTTHVQMTVQLTHVSASDSEAIGFPLCVEGAWDSCGVHEKRLLEPLEDTLDVLEGSLVSAQSPETCQSLREIVGRTLGPSEHLCDAVGEDHAETSGDVAPVDFELADWVVRTCLLEGVIEGGPRLLHLDVVEFEQLSENCCMGSSDVHGGPVISIQFA